jgi:hypothetical protein
MYLSIHPSIHPSIYPSSIHSSIHLSVYIPTRRVCREQAGLILLWITYNYLQYCLANARLDHRGQLSPSLLSWHRPHQSVCTLSESCSMGTTQRAPCAWFCTTETFCVGQLSALTQNTQNSSLVKRKGLFWLQFWSFQPMLDWPYSFRPVVRYKCVAEQSILTFWSGSKRERGRTGAHGPLQKHAPNDPRASN